MSVIDCFCLDQSCYDSAYNHQQKPFIAAPEISISSHAR